MDLTGIVAEIVKNAGQNQIAAIQHDMGSTEDIANPVIRRGQKQIRPTLGCMVRAIGCAEERGASFAIDALHFVQHIL